MGLFNKLNIDPTAAIITPDGQSKQTTTTQANVVEDEQDISLEMLAGYEKIDTIAQDPEAAVQQEKDNATTTNDGDEEKVALLQRSQRLTAIRVGQGVLSKSTALSKAMERRKKS